MGERLKGGSEDHVGGGHRIGNAPRGLRGVRDPLGDQGQNGIAPRIGGLLAHALAEVLGRGVGDDQNLLPLLDPEAIADNRPHRSVKIAHLLDPRADYD
jgi:hypothetical protein